MLSVLLTRTFLHERVGIALALKMSAAWEQMTHPTCTMSPLFHSLAEQQAAIMHRSNEKMACQGMTNLVKAQSRHDARAISICEGSGEGVQGYHSPASTKADQANIPNLQPCKRFGQEGHSLKSKYPTACFCHGLGVIHCQHHLQQDPSHCQGQH